MVNNLVPSIPSSSSSSIPLHKLSSSTVSNSEQQTHPSNNIVEGRPSGNNINIHEKIFNRHLNQQPINHLEAHSSHKQQRTYSTRPSDHHSMRGGEPTVVDLLSAFGLLHNISVHEPNVVLRPGAHSSAPAAVFSSSNAVSGSAIRHVRLDLNNFQNNQHDTGASRGRSSTPSSNEVTRYTFQS